MVTAARLFGPVEELRRQTRVGAACRVGRRHHRRPGKRAELRRPHPRYIALAEDCDELERQGHTREQIAARLGVTRDGLQRALSLYRQKQMEAAA